MSIAKLFNSTTVALGTISLVGMSVLVGANPVKAAGFSGQYNPSNWMTILNNSDGGVDTTNAPNSITIFGSNNGSWSYGDTVFATIATSKSIFSFDWNYSSSDEAYFDGFNIFIDKGGNPLNRLETGLAGYTLNGSSSFLVDAGDTFNFKVWSSDSVFGRGVVTISNFNATLVPEPTSVLGLLAVGTLAVSKLKLNQKENESDNNLN